MKNRLSAFALCLTFFPLASISAAQVSSRATAIQTFHCVEEKGLSAPLSGQGQWQVGFARDIRSYPGEEHIIVIVFSGTTAGQVFDVLRERSGPSVSLHIVNNAGLIVDSGKIELIDPLWGLWTRKHLEANTLKAIHSRRFLIKAEELKKAFPHVACSSYADQ